MVRAELRGVIESELTEFTLKLADPLIVSTGSITILIGPPHSGKSLAARTAAFKCVGREGKVQPESLRKLLEPKLRREPELILDGTFTYSIIDVPRIRALTCYLRWPYVSPNFVMGIYAKLYAERFDEFLEEEVSSDLKQYIYESLDVCKQPEGPPLRLGECIYKYLTRVVDSLKRRSEEEKGDI